MWWNTHISSNSKHQHSANNNEPFGGCFIKINIAFDFLMLFNCAIYIYMCVCVDVQSLNFKRYYAKI